MKGKDTGSTSRYFISKRKIKKRRAFSLKTVPDRNLWRGTGGGRCGLVCLCSRTIESRKGIKRSCHKGIKTDDDMFQFDVMSRFPVVFGQRFYRKQLGVEDHKCGNTTGECVTYLDLSHCLC